MVAPQPLTVIDRFYKLLEALIALCPAVMVIMVFGNVVLRYAFNAGIAVNEEVSRWLFVWLTFLGAIVTLKEHGHLGTGMLVSRLPLWGKKMKPVIEKHGAPISATVAEMNAELAKLRK